MSAEVVSASPRSHKDPPKEAVETQVLASDLLGSSSRSPSELKEPLGAHRSCHETSPVGKSGLEQVPTLSGEACLKRDGAITPSPYVLGQLLSTF